MHGGNCLFPVSRYRLDMAGNVFKFRRLKWGDPGRKLQMLPDESAPRPMGSVPWIELALLAIIATSLAISASYLI